MNGYNRFGHCKASSEETWHAFGHHYAPKESWETVLTKPGLLKLEMEGKRDGCDDRIQIRIESSPPYLVIMGIMVHVNQHREIGTNDAGIERTTEERNKAFLYGLQNDWDGFLQYAKEAQNHLLTAGFSRGTKPGRKGKA